MTAAPRITDVEIAIVETGIEITPVWSGVDRPRSGGYLVGPKHSRMAARLKRAMLAGAVYSGAEVRTDVNGRTYVRASSAVLGRRMNADLKRLGF